MLSHPWRGPMATPLEEGPQPKVEGTVGLWGSSEAAPHTASWSSKDGVGTKGPGPGRRRTSWWRSGNRSRVVEGSMTAFSKLTLGLESGVRVVALPVTRVRGTLIRRKDPLWWGASGVPPLLHYPIVCVVGDSVPHSWPQQGFHFSPPDDSRYICP